MKRVFLKPANKDAIVRDPIHKIPLPAEGKEIKLTTYWRRRLLDGSVVKTKKVDAKIETKVEPKK